MIFVTCEVSAEIFTKIGGFVSLPFKAFPGFGIDYSSE